MKFAVSSRRSIDFRVSTLPTLFGEKIVVRILDGSQAQLGIDALGYEPEQKATLMAAIQRPYGMVLVTGRQDPAKRCRSTPASTYLISPASTLPPPKTRSKSTCPA